MHDNSSGSRARPIHAAGLFIRQKRPFIEIISFSALYIAFLLRVFLYLPAVEDGAGKNENALPLYPAIPFVEGMRPEIGRFRLLIEIPAFVSADPSPLGQIQTYSGSSLVLCN
jgi:hypothetical protein